MKKKPLWIGAAVVVVGAVVTGMALKGETLGLAVMTELPLVICNIQRGGPSTGLPTKTEQADLMLAMFGRHCEPGCSTPIFACEGISPTTRFSTGTRSAASTRRPHSIIGQLKTAGPAHRPI